MQLYWICLQIPCRQMRCGLDPCPRVSRVKRSCIPTEGGNGLAAPLARRPLVNELVTLLLNRPRRHLRPISAFAYLANPGALTHSRSSTLDSSSSDFSASRSPAISASRFRSSIRPNDRGVYARRVFSADDVNADIETHFLSSSSLPSLSRMCRLENAYTLNVSR